MSRTKLTSIWPFRAGKHPWWGEGEKTSQTLANSERQTAFQDEGLPPPLGNAWRLEGSALHGAGRAFELLGAIRLRAANELVMVFEDGFVAIVQSDRSFEVSWIYFEVAWIELPDNSKARVVVGGS